MADIEEENYDQEEFTFDADVTPKNQQVEQLQNHTTLVPTAPDDDHGATFLTAGLDSMEEDEPEKLEDEDDEKIEAVTEAKTMSDNEVTAAAVVPSLASITGTEASQVIDTTVEREQQQQSQQSGFHQQPAPSPTDISHFTDHPVAAETSASIKSHQLDISEQQHEVQQQQHIESQVENKQQPLPQQSQHHEHPEEPQSAFPVSIAQHLTTDDDDTDEIGPQFDSIQPDTPPHENDGEDADLESFSESHLSDGAVPMMEVRQRQQLAQQQLQQQQQQHQRSTIQRQVFDNVTAASNPPLPRPTSPLTSILHSVQSRSFPTIDDPLYREDDPHTIELTQQLQAKLLAQKQQHMQTEIDRTMRRVLYPQMPDSLYPPFVGTAAPSSSPTSRYLAASQSLPPPRLSSVPYSIVQHRAKHPVSPDLFGTGVGNNKTEQHKPYIPSLTNSAPSSEFKQASKKFEQFLKEDGNSRRKHKKNHSPSRYLTEMEKQRIQSYREQHTVQHGVQFLNDLQSHSLSTIARSHVAKNNPLDMKEERLQQMQFYNWEPIRKQQEEIRRLRMNKTRLSSVAGGNVDAEEKAAMYRIGGVSSSIHPVASSSTITTSDPPPGTAIQRLNYLSSVATQRVYLIKLSHRRRLEEHAAREYAISQSLYEMQAMQEYNQDIAAIEAALRRKEEKERERIMNGDMTEYDLIFNQQQQSADAGFYSAIQREHNVRTAISRAKAKGETTLTTEQLEQEILATGGPDAESDVESERPPMKTTKRKQQPTRMDDASYSEEDMSLGEIRRTSGGQFLVPNIDLMKVQQKQQQQVYEMKYDLHTPTNAVGGVDDISLLTDRSTTSGVGAIATSMEDSVSMLDDTSFLSTDSGMVSPGRAMF